MVRLSKIYTKTGDRGRTMLGDGTTVPKHVVRVEAYGSVDEANALVGVVVASIKGKDALHREIREELMRVQHDLFDVGADLCLPIAKSEDEDQPRLRVTQAQIDRLERSIDRYTEELAPLDSFVLPGGAELSAHLHVARTVVRRAERCVAHLAEEQGPETNELALVYLNRLSDLLFVQARAANGWGKNDVKWIPGANRDG